MLSHYIYKTIQLFQDSFGCPFVFWHCSNWIVLDSAKFPHILRRHSFSNFSFFPTALLFCRPLVFYCQQLESSSILQCRTTSLNEQLGRYYACLGITKIYFSCSSLCKHICEGVNSVPWPAWLRSNYTELGWEHRRKWGEW